MYLSNLKFGLRDLFRSKLLLCSMTVYFICFLYILVSGLNSLEHELIQRRAHQMTAFTLTPISFDTDISRNLIEELRDIYDENAFSWYQVFDGGDGAILDDHEGWVNVYVSLGNPKLAGIDWVPEEGRQAYYNTSYKTQSGSSTLENSISVRKLNFPLMPLPEHADLSYFGSVTYMDDLPEPAIYIFADSFQFLQLMSRQSYDQLGQVMINTRILSTDQARIKQFLALSEISLFDIRPSTYKEVSFIKYYLLPFLSISLLMVLISFMILTHDYMNRLRRTMVLHFIHGATASALNLRFMIIPLGIALFSILLLALSGFFSIYPRGKFIAGICLLLFFTISELTVVHTIHQKNFTDRIRGEE